MLFICRIYETVFKSFFLKKKEDLEKLFDKQKINNTNKKILKERVKEMQQPKEYTHEMMDVLLQSLHMNDVQLILHSQPNFSVEKRILSTYEINELLKTKSIFDGYSEVRGEREKEQMFFEKVLDSQVLYNFKPTHRKYRKRLNNDIFAYEYSSKSKEPLNNFNRMNSMKQHITDDQLFEQRGMDEMSRKNSLARRINIETNGIIMKNGFFDMSSKSSLPKKSKSIERIR